MDLSDAKWKKSSLTGSNGGNCVEVATVEDTTGRPHLIAVRDSKDPHGPKLLLTHTTWTTFLNHLKTNRLNIG
ncbi:DUF397 domain-containing protein [Streptosporangium sp. NPDC006930]|uniref:DUF397 domain-containing protein n=1 Tax=Streptosporangium sp. NPDC006930 TaxID=3154783 RepID=UPI00342FBE75